MKKIFLLIITTLNVLVLWSQDYAVQQLEKSPRHHEWVEVKNGDRIVHCFVAFPERPRNTPAVIVIHENRGLTDWVRSLADQLAAEGFLAIAPDLLSGFSPEMNRTTDFENSDAARNALYQLAPEQVAEDLNRVYDYIASAPSSNGKVAVIGFCWGGSQAFRMAVNNSKLSAALVFYGTGPTDPEEIKKISAPVYGFYGENDQRVNATIPESAQLMAAAGKTYEYEIYSGAGHAYMRSADDPAGNKESRKAKKKSIKRVKKIMNSL